MSVFDQRWKVLLLVLALVYFLAIFGVTVAIYIPFIGGPLFLAGLAVWYFPGKLFYWTGFFEFHEFGASPNGWQGHVMMFLFYLGIAGVISLPFGRKRKK